MPFNSRVTELDRRTDCEQHIATFQIFRIQVSAATVNGVELQIQMSLILFPVVNTLRNSLVQVIHELCCFCSQVHLKLRRPNGAE